jgi:hypothetical protein
MTWPSAEESRLSSAAGPAAARPDEGWDAECARADSERFCRVFGAGLPGAVAGLDGAAAVDVEAGASAGARDRINPLKVLLEIDRTPFHTRLWRAVRRFLPAMVRR